MSGNQVTYVGLYASLAAYQLIHATVFCASYNSHTLQPLTNRNVSCTTLVPLNVTFERRAAEIHAALASIIWYCVMLSTT